VKRIVSALTLAFVASGFAWWATRLAVLPTNPSSHPAPSAQAASTPAPEVASVTPVAGGIGAASSWKEELKTALKALPRREKLQELPAHKIHHPPRLLTDGARVVGEIWEKAERDPHKRVGALEFLLACAEDDGTLLALRAVCWRKLTDGIISWNLLIPLAQAKVPDNIQELATQLNAE
jgi:hypothetical protein